MRILGILNLSADSFSDGGCYDTVERALAQGRALMEHGAAAVDVGAVSSNPDSAGLPPDEELASLRAVCGPLRAAGIPVSIDTFSPHVQRAMAGEVDWINDIAGFADPSVWPVLADAPCGLMVMHSVQRGRADRREAAPDTIVDDLLRFFDGRLADLVGAGVDEERIVVDPGMGFFLGSDPRASVAVLRAVPRIRAHTGRPVLIGVSRKSFLGALLGGRAVGERHDATVAAERYAVEQGADWIRTHDVRALRDALRIERALS